MLVKDIAQTDVVTVEVETPLADVARTMRDERVGSVVVVDAKGVVAGLLTDRDLVVYGLAGDRPVGDLVANDIFSTNVFNVDPDDGITEVVDKMHDEGVRRVPVMSDGDLVGIVTLDDLLCHLSKQLEELADVVRGEFPR
ncbi:MULTISPECIES: CBS domain-containing protein [Haloferax]|uniref:CBS domain-containing protein n=2 Tax=Haloferax TaxID=2251 RepID=A0A6A8GJM2_9EURY|nr:MULTISPECIES: CBS domain-containing protein [Haloferax]KAB1194462.1 CBS domain-containing protein [Haloferax sp. CBA1148]KTG08053.1 cbs domain containing protein [Haloferax profundi]MRX23029.1 CBS domain-containing protein [Haloferax litoreum]